MMPFEGVLNDDEMAAVLTYVRNAFGDKASAISPEEVKAIRSATRDRTEFYSSEELLKEHETNWNKARLAYFKLIQTEKEGEGIEKIDEKLSHLKEEFSNALEENLNTHMALSAFYRLVTFCFGNEEHLTKSVAQKIIPTFEEMMNVLGLKIDKVSDDEKIQIQNLIKQREEFREQKMYQEADDIRDKLDAKGIELKDEIHQTIWMKKE